MIPYQFRPVREAVSKAAMLQIAESPADEYEYRERLGM
jgi:hypothetical protein